MTTTIVGAGISVSMSALMLSCILDLPQMITGSWTLDCDWIIASIIYC